METVNYILNLFGLEGKLFIAQIINFAVLLVSERLKQEKMANIMIVMYVI